jgi:Phosphohistidine swiveling domain
MESNLPTINSVEFWARETLMPLFWLTDSEHYLGESTLFLYKNEMLHIYYLNDSAKKYEDTGFDYFSKEKNILLFEKESQEIIMDVNDTFNKYNEFDLKKLNSEELVRLFDVFRMKLNKFSELYTRAEDLNTRKLTKEDVNLEKIATVRLELRKSLPLLFDIVFGNFLQEVARRNELDAQKDLFFYLFDEMVGLLNSGRKVEEGEMIKRRTGLAFLREGKQSRLFIDNDALVLWNKVNDLVLPKDKSEIRGTPVFGGVVKGRARVIFQSNDEKIIKNGYNLEKGEIIVTDMTKPDMMIACMKAIGIITDEGGVVCHASIIAREFKKPCIVGTKIGTQVIKDGDLLELDADKGVVKVLNNK